MLARGAGVGTGADDVCCAPVPDTGARWSGSVVVVVVWADPRVGCTREIRSSRAEAASRRRGHEDWKISFDDCRRRRPLYRPSRSSREEVVNRSLPNRGRWGMPVTRPLAGRRRGHSTQKVCERISDVCVVGAPRLSFEWCIRLFPCVGQRRQTDGCTAAEAVMQSCQASQVVYDRYEVVYVNGLPPGAGRALSALPCG